VVTESTLADAAAHEPDWTAVEVSEDDVALTVYADGSSGPVPVPMTHGAVARAARFLARPGERWLAHCWQASDLHALELWGPLLQGGACVFGPVSAAERHGVEALLLTAAAARVLCSTRAASLRRLVLPSHDPVAASLLADVRDKHPEAEVVLAYRAGAGQALAVLDRNR